MRRFALILMLLMLPVVALGATYYVDPQGIDDPGVSGAVDDPWATIAYAHGRMSDGDTLKLVYGTYSETLNITKALTITAAITDPALSPRPIIIAAAGGAATITAKASTGAQVYEYLDIRGLLGTSNYAVVVEADTDARTFSDCLFSDALITCVRATGNNGTLAFTDCTFTGVNNSGTITDHAVRVYNAALTMTGCTITGTTEQYAVLVDSTNLGAITITGCTVGNTQKFASGGLYVNAAPSANISNNTVNIPAIDQAATLIYVLNTPAARIADNDITALSMNQTLKIIHANSSGTLMPGVVISNNTIRCRHAGGHTILVGADGSGTGNRLLPGAIVEFNRLWGALYYAFVRTITIDATGGTWTLTVDGQTTGNLAYNITAANLKTAIEALSGVGTVTVYTASSVYTIAFNSTAARTVATNAAGLTGGNHTATVGDPNTHGPMIGYSGAGQLRYNYVNGVGLGCIAKAGAVVAATAEADDDTFTTGAAHGLSVGQPIWFTSLGTAEGISLNTKYYVASVPGATSFTVSSTLGGSAVDVTADGSVTYDTLNWERQGGIHHNITVNCSTNHIALSGVMGVVVEYNTCYQGVAAGSTGRPMIRQKKDDSVNAYCFGTTVRNNICYGYASNYVFGQDQAGHTGTTITNNCWYMPGTTNLFNLDGTPSNWATFAAAYPTGNINVDPKFMVRGKDFRLAPNSPCANSGSRDRVYMGGSVLYLPQWAFGAIAPVFEPIKPVE